MDFTLLVAAQLDKRNQFTRGADDIELAMRASAERRVKWQRRLTMAVALFHPVFRLHGTLAASRF